MQFGRVLRYAACFIAGASVMSAGNAASSLLGPKGKFTSTFINDLEYDPSKACYKPSQPIGDSEFAWNLYKQQGGEYIECLKAASVSDIDFANEVITDGYKKAVSEFIDEVKRGY